MSDLIITNGDDAADLLAAGGLPGRMLPWRDMLYEGPLVKAPGLEALSDIRASFLSQRFGLPYGEVRADFVARDAVFRANRLFERVVIWVEHDLYDQLQLLQVLAALADEQRTEAVMLVQADDFLGHQSPETVLRFATGMVAVTPDMFAIAAGLWQALREASPRALARAIATIDNRTFPFLRRALIRFLEELPWVGSGVSRTQQTMLSAIASSRMTPQSLFGLLVEAEDAAFMGDWSAFRALEDMVFVPEPLVSGFDTAYACRGDARANAAWLQRPLAATPFGRAVLAGNADHVAANGIDRWWGGTHLSGHDPWRWDAGTRRLVPPRRSAKPNETR